MVQWTCAKPSASFFPAVGFGRCMHLLTNVLDKMLLSDEQAEAIYRNRRGIELVYRPLKQTMGRRRMRCEPCRKPSRVNRRRDMDSESSPFGSTRCSVELPYIFYIRECKL